MAHPVLQRDGVVVRPSDESDFGFLRELFDDPTVCERWGGRLTDDEIRAKYLGARSPTVECFVVERDGSQVGLAQYHRADDGGEGGGMDMALLADFRSKGTGAAVVRLIVTHVRDQLGWSRFTVDPDVSNVRGIEFWRKAGFVPVRIVDGGGRAPYWLMQWPGGSQ